MICEKVRVLYDLSYMERIQKKGTLYERMIESILTEGNEVSESNFQYRRLFQKNC